MSINFERATRKKYRYESARGYLTTEDLWDLPLTESDFCLDNIAKVLSRHLKETEEESFVITSDNKARKILEEKLDIVKHVIKYRLDAINKANKRMETIEKKKKIMSILEDKKDDALKDKSVEELEKLLEEV